ncbi:carbohydrate kinase family protein [bacterium]|nr:carbohydrate kinase family protein [bacterium]
MSRIFVAGLINLETTIAIDGFPLEYFPCRYPFFGLQTTVSGVGFNVANALTTLGNSVQFASLIGKDDNGRIAREALIKDGITDELVLDFLKETAQSVILYDPEGRRQIHVDLKDIQEQVYPLAAAKAAIEACDLAVICNVNFARPLLAIAHEAGKPIATDVHALADLEDDYNRDYIQAAEILFLSDESLPKSPEKVLLTLMGQTSAEIVVIGLGEEGAVMAVRRDGYIGWYPAVKTRPVVNTVGAGDALFSAFVDQYLRTNDPYAAIEAATIFASYKIGEKGAAQGFLTGPALDEWVKRTVNQKEKNA